MDKFLATQLSVPNLSEGGSISKHYFLDLPEGHLFVHRLLVNNAFYYSQCFKVRSCRSYLLRRRGSSNPHYVVVLKSLVNPLVWEYIKGYICFTTAFICCELFFGFLYRSDHMNKIRISKVPKAYSDVTKKSLNSTMFPGILCLIRILYLLQIHILQPLPGFRPSSFVLSTVPPLCTSPPETKNILLLCLSCHCFTFYPCKTESIF